MSFAELNVGLLTRTPGYFEEKSWYAIRTRPRFEKKVVGELQCKEVETFLPLSNVTRQWSDRKQNVSVPLFSGYLFVRINPREDSRLQVLKAQ